MTSSEKSLETRKRLAPLLASLNRPEPYTMSELCRALRNIEREHPQDAAAFDVGIDLSVFLFRIGWIDKVENMPDSYVCRIPKDGRVLSLPPPPPDQRL